MKGRISSLDLEGDNVISLIIDLSGNLLPSQLSTHYVCCQSHDTIDLCDLDQIDVGSKVLENCDTHKKKLKHYGYLELRHYMS